MAKKKSNPVKTVGCLLSLIFIPFAIIKALVGDGISDKKE